MRGGKIMERFFECSQSAVDLSFDLNQILQKSHNFLFIEKLKIFF